jgi:predicted dehydrogenase
MIKLAIIGTNWITGQFVEAALKTGEYKLAAVYSRSMESARQFGEKYGSPTLFNDLEELAASPLIDAVYIASPNVLHGPQAVQMMQGGKHVIVEKPMASNYALAQKMFEVAEDNGVLLFEAFMSPHLPNFRRLKESLSSIGAIRKGFISYCQYSSRYPKYLAGENPNTFNPEFANGSIMDIGFYSVAAAVELFGVPTQIQASAHLLESGVDAHGSVLLRYPEFDVTLSHSKVSNSYSTSEIQGEEGSLILPDFSECMGFDLYARSGERTHFETEQVENSMVYEAKAFASMIWKGKMDEYAIQRSLTIAHIITEVRRQTGVVFPADVNS